MLAVPHLPLVLAVQYQALVLAVQHQAQLKAGLQSLAAWTCQSIVSQQDRRPNKAAQDLQIFTINSHRRPPLGVSCTEATTPIVVDKGPGDKLGLAWKKAGVKVLAVEDSSHFAGFDMSWPQRYSPSQSLSSIQSNGLCHSHSLRNCHSLHTCHVRGHGQADCEACGICAFGRFETAGPIPNAGKLP